MTSHSYKYLKEGHYIMTKKLFNYHYHPTHSPSDFLNLVFEIDEDEVSKVHFEYYRDQKLMRLWTYDPNESSFIEYEEGKEKFEEIFTNSSSLSMNDLIDKEIKWSKDQNSWEGNLINLETFLVRLSNMMDTDRPFWVISIFTKYLYDQTQDYIEWLREEQPDQEYLIPTNISKINQWVYHISLPQIKDDRLKEMIDELLGEESDYSYQYYLDERDGQTFIEVQIES